MFYTFFLYFYLSLVSTKAEVRFNVHTADWIPEDVRQKIFEKVCCSSINYVHKNDWILICQSETVTIKPKQSALTSNILKQNKNCINKAGELFVTSDLRRSQQRNLSECIQRISAIIAKASEKLPEPTAEDIALRATRYWYSEQWCAQYSLLKFNVKMHATKYRYHDMSKNNLDFCIYKNT